VWAGQGAQGGARAHAPEQSAAPRHGGAAGGELSRVEARRRPRRLYIPKADGRQRPIGVAALEDKIVQKALGAVLEAIWEGEIIIVRYADDFGMGFQKREDAERLLAAMRQRFARFALETHTEKTRLLEFGRFANDDRLKRGAGRPQTFDFLGFTHICAKRRSDGKFTVWRRTIAKRMRAKLAQIKEELRRRRHEPIPELGKWLKTVVAGRLNYHAVPDNLARMKSFRDAISRLWLRALRRRSQKGRAVTWERMTRLIQAWIPPVRLKHPYPDKRLRVIHPR